MQEIPYVGTPAMRVNLPSVAPVDMVATRGTPGRVMLSVFSMALVTSGSNGEGGTGTTGTALPSGPVCDTMVILTLGSLATRSRVLRISCGSSPGKIRQLTLARADVNCRIFPDRKSTRLNSSHGYISYAVFCLKKKRRYRIASMSCIAV